MKAFENKFNAYFGRPFDERENLNASAVKGFIDRHYEQSQRATFKHNEVSLLDAAGMNDKYQDFLTNRLTTEFHGVTKEVNRDSEMIEQVFNYFEKHGVTEATEDKVFVALVFYKIGQLRGL